MAATTSQAHGTRGLLGHGELVNVPEEEVRLAVVLNGGVSLAVWMGGVVLELDRLTKARSDEATPYGVLKRLTGCRARVDVITGTSAGGINGAALALTQVNRHASPAALRDLWIEQGRLENLLRQPFRGQPRSLLQGDEYFLPALNAALGRLANGTGWVSADDAPVDLTITTTVIGGNQAVSVDSMGQPLPQRLHAGRFRFQRRAGATDDPFSQERLARTADRLALASRSSASFPFAFEPSYVPVCHPDYRERPGVPLTPEQKLRPDMGDHVEFWGNPGQTTNRSRYCADGGALSNTPTREALAAIEAMPASGPVRRVVLLVFPHAPAEQQDPPDERDQPFELTKSLTGLLGALTAQGSRTYVEELERHNLTVAGRRGTRSEVLDQLLETDGGGAVGPDALTALTGSVYDQYRRLRRRRAGRNLAAWRTGMAPDGLMGASLPEKWSYERVRSAAERAQQLWESPADGSAGDVLPYVPQRPPTVDHFRTTVGQWDWGIDAALGVTEGAADLLRRLVWILPRGADFDAVNTARREVFRLAQQIREARHLTDDPWEKDPTLLQLPPTRPYWTLRVAFYAYLMTGGVTENGVADKVERLDEAPQEVAGAVAAALQDGRGGLRPPACAGAEIRDLVNQTVDTLLGCVDALGRYADTPVGRDAGLPGWHALLVGADRLTALTRLMQLEVVSTALGDEVSTGASIPVELVQVSAETQNPFATITTHGAEKLGGDAVNRFGGFLKRSWRVNDWIWGRADGASVLARTLLDPKRVRRAARVCGYITRHEPADAGDVRRVRALHDAQAKRCARETLDGVLTALGLDEAAFPADAGAAYRELYRAFDFDYADPDLPSAMPALANIFAWALHLDSLPGELPALASAIVGDRVDGANPRSRGEQFVAQHDDLLRRLGDPHHAPDEADARRALAAFDGAGIGSEPLHEEAGSDLLIRTVSSAAAVVTTVADSPGSGLGALKPVTRTLRGGMLLPYWGITGLARGGVARALALLAFALGGTALALALLGVLPEGLQPVAAAAGAGAVLGAFAYGALRTGSLLHGVVLLSPVVPLVVYALDNRPTDDTNGVSTFLVVLAVVVGLMLLGSIPMASGSVWAAVDRLADRQGFVRPAAATSRRSRTGSFGRTVGRRVLAVVWAGLTALAWLAGLALLVWAVWRLAHTDLLGWVQEHLWVWPLVLLALLVCGWLSDRSGRSMQVLSPTGDKDRPYAYAPVADARALSAGWAVVYAAGFAVIAFLVSLPVWDDGQGLGWRTAFAASAAYAVALLLLSLVLPGLAVRAAARRECQRPWPPLPPGAPDVAVRQREYAKDLVQRGSSHRRFVRLVNDDDPRLTPRGESLDLSVHRARAATDLETRWHAPRTLSEDDVARLAALFPAWEQSLGGNLGAPLGKRVAAVREGLAAGIDRDKLRYLVDRLLVALR